MENTKTKRKLTAILSADVKGYSRLMGEDEKGTVATLKQYREIISFLVEEHSGRVIDSPGDNLLAEFGSVVDAVECAVTVQKTLKDENATLPENRRMEFRIGVNLGDVIEDEGRIYGDGVNVAARVEGLADGRGICVSGTAFDQIGKKLPLGYEFLGEQTVKNIEKPVRAYKVLMEPEDAGKVIGEARQKPRQWRWAAIGGMVVLIAVIGILAVWHHYLRPDFQPASVERMAYPLPEKPSIAVLPFDNLTGDPQQDYIADGFTEDVITALSKVPKLFVIARTSTFTYKGKPVKIQQIAEDLGVRYVLEGSVRQSQDNMRITAQLIDATSGKHLWAERYDRELKDMFALQDEITKSIIVALQVELTEGEQARVYYGKGTESLDAYLKHLKSREYFMNFKMDLAKETAREVIALDPEWSQGYARLATLLLMEVWFHVTKSPKQALEEAESLAKKAIQMNSSLALPHAILGQTYLLKRQFDKAVAEGEVAVNLCPSCADNIAWLGMILRSVGRPEEAIQYLEKAIRLSPLASGHVYVHLGLAHFFAGQYHKAFDALKTAHNERPKFMPALLGLAAVGTVLEEEEQADDAVREILELHPQFSLNAFAKTLPYKRQTDKELLINALSKAGLPTEPPLPLPDKPSIAVLPFTNMSGDPEQEYFSDGISEEIITFLSKVSGLFVIARTSSFKYKGKEVDVRDVGRELGVRYVLEGSVQRSGERVRINGQLIDASTGHHLWAERYDRDLKDIFEIQDDITKQIIAALNVKLTIGGDALQIARGTDSLEAYLKYLQARERHMRFTKEDNLASRGLFEEAISIDPEFGVAYSFLAMTHFLDVVLQATKSPGQSITKAIELAKKGVALSNAGHDVLGFLYLNTKQYDKAIAECERAVHLDPNSATAHTFYGLTLTQTGYFEDAVDQLEQGVRLDPTSSFGLRSLAIAYSFVGRHEEAIATCKKAIQKAPKDLVSHIILTRAYSMAGRVEEAQNAAAEVLRINPNFSLESYAKRVSFKNQTHHDRVVEALRDAGLK